MDLKQKSNNLAQTILDAIVSYGEGDCSYDILCNLEEDIFNILTKPTNVKIYSDNDELDIPSYSTDGSVCVDLRVNTIEIRDNKIVIGTGIHIELPEYYEAEIRPRSSITKTNLLFQNSPATIDYDYRGEIKLIFAPIDNTPLYQYYLNYEHNNKIDKKYFPYGIGDRCAQLLIRNVEKIHFEKVNDLSDLGETKRGQNGFGSTGTK